MWHMPARGMAYPIHTRLGKVMAFRDLTASEVASASGVHPRTLTEYLAGREPIRPQHLQRLADALGVSPDVIFEEEPSQPTGLKATSIRASTRSPDVEFWYGDHHGGRDEIDVIREELNR